MHSLRHYINLVESYIRVQEADQVEWTEQNITDLKKMYDDNWPYEDMAAYFGIKYNTVHGVVQFLRNALNKFYPDRKRRNITWTDKEKQELFQLRQKKYTYQQIADHFGISSSAVDNALHKYFPDREKIDNSYRGITMADAEKMTDQYKNGRGTISIARDYNIVSKNVYAWMQKYCEEMGADFRDIQQQFKANRSAYRARQAQKTIVRPGTQDNLRSKGPGGRHRADYRGKQY